MSFTLEKVVPWGRTYEEYVAMFALDKEALAKKILGCGDGPASFNAMHTQRGGSVVSVDPLYQFTKEEIAGRIEEARRLVMEQIRANADEHIWTNIRSPDHLEEIRMGAMRAFLEDFPKGKSGGRYVVGALPELPFGDKAFDLALVSHFLLHYAGQLDFEFHKKALCELCRVAKEVRVFPILELGAKRSRHVDGLVAAFRSNGYRAAIERVDYEFIKGGNEMLRLGLGRGDL